MRRANNGPKLPPGSMGWPGFGETLKLYSQTPSVFFGERHKRYIQDPHTWQPMRHAGVSGGCSICIGDRSTLVSADLPKKQGRVERTVGSFYHDGRFHSKMRKLVQGSLSLDRIRTMVPAIEGIAVSTLESCCFNGGRAISSYREMKKFAFEVAVLSVFGELGCKLKDKLMKNYFALDKGYNCFAVNLPGTSYCRAFLARRRLAHLLGEVLRERRGKKLEQKNLLSSLLSHRDKNGQILTDDQVVDNIVAAQDTTASALTWVIKYIHDDPELKRNLKREQEAIFVSNGRGNWPLTWAQTRNMSYTRKLVMESLRMASIITHIFREAVEDIVYNGVLIPEGWKVLPLFCIIHHNPEFFRDPEKFDPSRFEVGAPRPNTYVPFGNGVHSCPGNELAKLEILIMIHHLVNNFRWEVVDPKNGVDYDPFAVPKKGLLANLKSAPQNPSGKQSQKVLEQTLQKRYGSIMADQERIQQLRI